MDKRTRSTSSKPWRRWQCSWTWALLSTLPTFSFLLETQHWARLFSTRTSQPTQLLPHFHSPLTLCPPDTPTESHLCPITHSNHSQWELTPSPGESNIKPLLLTFERFCMGVGMGMCLSVYVRVCICVYVRCVCLICVCVVCVFVLYICLFTHTYMNTSAHRGQKTALDPQKFSKQLWAALMKVRYQMILWKISQSS